MKLVAMTLALDAMPFITEHLPILEKSGTDFHWIVVEGAAQNNGSTAWCQPQKPRLSNDDTTAYLRGLKDKRVTVIQKPNWKSKDEMCNAALAKIAEDCCLLQIDHDEIWKPEQIATIVSLFAAHHEYNSMMFACRYFVGPKLITEGHGCFGDNDYEWRRAWRFSPGDTFITHEPPRLSNSEGVFLGKDFTRQHGLVFDHFSYVTEEQVKFKQSFYGYDSGLVNAWRALQKNDKWPTPLNRWFSFLKADEKAMVVKA